MRWYGINIPYLILSHPEIVGEDMISWTIAGEMRFMKAIQAFFSFFLYIWRVENGPGSGGSQMPLVSGSWFVTAGIQKSPGLDDTRMPTLAGHSHVISILLLFIGHLGSRKTGSSQWCKEDSKAQCFGLVKCTIKPFKMSSTHQRLKTNVAFWLSMGTT